MSENLTFKGSASSANSGLMSKAILASLLAATTVPQHNAGQIDPKPISQPLFKSSPLYGGASPTFSSHAYASQITGKYVFEMRSLDDQISDFYSKLVVGQESLGSEFEKVLHENLWDLYEA